MPELLGNQLCQTACDASDLKTLWGTYIQRDIPTLATLGQE